MFPTNHGVVLALSCKSGAKRLVHTSGLLVCLGVCSGLGGPPQGWACTLYLLMLVFGLKASATAIGCYVTMHQPVLSSQAPIC